MLIICLADEERDVAIAHEIRTLQQVFLGLQYPLVKKVLPAVRVKNKPVSLPPL